MTATAADRRHARSVELVMELRASLTTEHALDQQADRRIGVSWRFVVAVRSRIVAIAPATSPVFAYLERGLHAMRAYVHFDRKRDRENEYQEALTLELAGLIDGVEAHEPAAASA